MNLRKFIRENVEELYKKKGEVENFRHQLSTQLGIVLDLYFVNPETGPALKLTLIKIPKEKQRQGIGTKAMEEICKYADENGYRIFLTPVTDFGSSKQRLFNFYKSFGFIKQSNRNRDFHFSDTMVRTPIGVQNLNESRMENNPTINKILKKFDVKWSDKIDSGTYGTAFYYGNYVLKISTDANEAVFANKIKHKKFERIAEVEGVSKIIIDKNVNKYYYIIVLERLEPLHSNEIMLLYYMPVIDEFYSKHKERLNFDDFIFAVKDYKIDIIYDYKTAASKIQETDADVLYDLYTEYKKLIDFMMHHKDIPMDIGDMHAGNMGYKNGKLAFYDIRIVNIKDSQIKKIKNQIFEQKIIGYHGTNSDFSNFDKSFIGSTNDPGDFGKGFYFSSDFETANAYSHKIHGKVKRVEINLQNPLLLDGVEYSKFNRSKKFGEIDKSEKNPVLQNYINIFLNAGAQFKYEPDTFLSVSRQLGADKVTEILQSAGYDGVIIKWSDNSSEIAVFDESNIKVIDSIHPI